MEHSIMVRKGVLFVLDGDSQSRADFVSGTWEGSVQLGVRAVQRRNGGRSEVVLEKAESLLIAIV